MRYELGHGVFPRHILQSPTWEAGDRSHDFTQACTLHHPPRLCHAPTCHPVPAVTRHTRETLQGLGGPRASFKDELSLELRAQPVAAATRSHDVSDFRTLRARGRILADRGRLLARAEPPRLNTLGAVRLLLDLAVQKPVLRCRRCPFPPLTRWCGSGRP